MAIVGAVISAFVMCSVPAGQADPFLAIRAQLTYLTGSSGTVWIADFDGKNGKRLGPGTQPLLSPDSSHVAASVFPSKGNSLAIYSPTSKIRKFFDISKVSARALSWSPDSRYLAVQLTNVSSNGGALAVVDMQTNKATTIATGSICGASFAPATDQLAYGVGTTKGFCANSNVFTVAVDGSGRTQLTHDGRSLNPVWGAAGIAFDRETLRKLAPSYQIWLMHPDGTSLVQLTNMKIPSLLFGLVPLQFSGNGQRLLAEYAGEDTSETWTLEVRTKKTHHILVNKLDVTPGAISFDGKSLVIDFGGFMNPPSAGTVESVPFAGGPAKVLVKHAGEPDWTL
jgi:hypothetical protein